jgi:GNAT superfamily N-acetyltransferase
MELRTTGSSAGRRSQPRVRAAAPEEAGEIGRLLGEAFMDDPVSTWAWPDAEVRRAVHPRFFGVFAKHGLAGGMVDVTEDGAGAAVWLPVPAGSGGGGGTAGSAGSAGGGDRMGADIAEALGESGERSAVINKLMEQHHPHERAHLYLLALGVLPGRQGGGLGRALLEPVLERCDRQGVPAYLEASSERSAALYARLGFATIGQTIDLPDGPSMWPMWRQPRVR